MSDTVEEKEVLETIEEEEEIKTPIKKEKNPNRVKAGLKLAAIGQKAKEEKMRKRVQDEMYKPSTWILMGVTLTSIGFLGLYFSPLFPKIEKEIPKQEAPKERKPTNYFG